MPIKTKTSTECSTNGVQAAKEKSLKFIVYVELFMFHFSWQYIVVIKIKTKL